LKVEDTDEVPVLEVRRPVESPKRSFRLLAKR